MRWIERRLLRLSDELERLRRQEELAAGELGMHEHLADDAIRDAVVRDAPLERHEARQTEKDVARLRSALAGVRRKIERLSAKRDRLLDRLDRR
jgi:hypothetical protein